MRRQLPEPHEVAQLTAYFLERLVPGRKFAPKKEQLNLKKGDDHYARRELTNISTPEQIVVWSYQWCSDEDWRRARDSVRSQRYTARNDLSRVSIRRDTKELIERRAALIGMPLWKYLCHLRLTDELMADIEDRADRDQRVDNH